MNSWNQHLNGAIAEAVSRHAGRQWRVQTVRDLSDLACHPCAILSDGRLAVFAKYSDARDAIHPFELEQASLEYLASRAGVMVPTFIGIAPVDCGAIFITEALEEIERGPLQWRQIGRTLARLHRIKSDFCGFPMNNFIGPLSQDNTPTRDWATFYRERRLIPFLEIAIRSGQLPSAMAAQVEKVIQRMPELCGPEVRPALLHGDAQKNNYISTPQGAYLIDPAVYFGNPEIDLAYMDYFEPVPADVFAAYQEEMPIDPGFAGRRNLWRISGYLAAVAVEGQQHLFRLANALRDYL